jgi:hypothetical protein
MVALAGFDANKVEPSKGFGLIPADDYDAIIATSEEKTTNAGDGKYVSLTFQIISGEFQNRRLWLNLNLWNKSSEAVEIAKGQLSAICRAVAVMTPQDTSELHDKPMKITVGQRKNKQSGNIENVINGFKPRQAGPAQPVQQVNQPVATATGSPW